MPLVVYNTLSREKEPFEPVRAGQVGIYLCGPTVYKPSHIGHAVGPIIFDAIKRYLTWRLQPVKVTFVVNITDVDDKIIEQAALEQTTAPQLAARIAEDYQSAMKRLHVYESIDHWPKASEHIGDICAMISTLIDRGYAYVSGGDVYFDVTRDEDYGKLSNRRLEEQEGQRQLKSGEKRHPGDFALWKAAKPSEPDEVKYDSPWGKGRPGWHIECSAMSSRYLGETFDIHGGGLDLVFPHHENEVAQSESATGNTFAKYWLHHGLTRVNTKKISKSDTDPQMQEALRKMTLTTLLQTYSPELIRFFILSTHYRRPIEYSEEELESKRKGLETFYRLFERVERVCGRSPYAAAGLNATASSAELAAACDEQQGRFVESMDDDFNTAGATAAMFELASAINRFIDQHRLEASGPTEAAADKLSALNAAGRLVALGQIIGLFLDPPPKAAGDNELTDRVMQVLIRVRQHLRKKKDFETADLLREQLKAAGVTLEDRPDGTIWRAE